MEMAHEEGLYSFQCGWEVLFDSTWEAIPSCKGWAQHWTPRFADKYYGTITASVPFGGSNGEQVYIQISENPPGTSWLGITSTSNFGLYDLGKNDRNITKLIAAVVQVLAGKGIAVEPVRQAVPVAAPPPAAAQPQQASPAAATQPQQAPTAFCAKCGAPMTAEKKFCRKCGQAVQG